MKTLVKLAAGIWEGSYPVWKSAKPGVQRPARVGRIETANTFIHPWKPETVPRFVAQSI